MCGSNSDYSVSLGNSESQEIVEPQNICTYHDTKEYIYIEELAMVYQDTCLFHVKNATRSNLNLLILHFLPQVKIIYSMCFVKGKIDI